MVPQISRYGLFISARMTGPLAPIAIQRLAHDGFACLITLCHCHDSICRHSRGPDRGPGHRIIPAPRVPSVQKPTSSQQLSRPEFQARPLIIRRSWVRAPPAPPFTEHRNIPDLRPDPADSRPTRQQAADKLRAAIRSAELAPGDALPSVSELHEMQGLKPGTVRHAFLALADEGLVHIRHGRTTTIAGDPAADEPGTRLQITRPRPGHDCKLSGCRPHVCKPMAKSTIHGIHGILSGAFEAAMRWKWTDRNPAWSARPPP
jgi:DNA-binding transcriptional regulator YhcF (GntR family)